MRSLTALIALSLLLAGCAQSPQTQTQRALSDRIFTAVMDRVPQYRDERNAKAMAACIAWDQDGRFKKIVGLPWYRTGQGSDILFPAGQLMNDAMLVCEREHEGNEGCTCHKFALNDRNVLVVP